MDVELVSMACIELDSDGGLFDGGFYDGSD